MDKKTRNILIGVGAACAAGLAMFGARKLNEKVCKVENEKTRIKEATEIGHLNDVRAEVVRLKGNAGLMIHTDDSVYLFLEHLNGKKETQQSIEHFLAEKEISKENFRGIIASSFAKGLNDIYEGENPELVNLDENSILYNKPVFLPPDATSVDFGIPIKVGRSVMISAGMASTGPIAFPVGIGRRITKQGLLLNVRDKGLVLFVVDDGKDLITIVQQLFAFGNELHSVVLMNDEGSELGFVGRVFHKGMDMVSAGFQKVKVRIGNPAVDDGMREKKAILMSMITNGVVLCGNHGITSTMDFKEFFDEDIQVVKFGECFEI